MPIISNSDAGDSKVEQRVETVVIETLQTIDRVRSSKEAVKHGDKQAQQCDEGVRSADK